MGIWYFAAQPLSKNVVFTTCNFSDVRDVCVCDVNHPDFEAARVQRGAQGVSVACGLGGACSPSSLFRAFLCLVHTVAQRHSTASQKPLRGAVRPIMP